MKKKGKKKKEKKKKTKKKKEKEKEKKKKKKRTRLIMGFAVPADLRIKLKEGEKKNKHLDLARELKRVWNMKVRIACRDDSARSHSSRVSLIETTEIRPVLSVRQRPGRPRFNLRSSHTKDSKMVLDASLFNTQHYKVRIKGRGEILGKDQCPPLHLGVVAIEKGAFGLPSTKGS